MEPTIVNVLTPKWLTVTVVCKGPRFVFDKATNQIAVMRTFLRGADLYYSYFPAALIRGSIMSAGQQKFGWRSINSVAELIGSDSTDSPPNLFDSQEYDLFGYSRVHTRYDEYIPSVSRKGAVRMLPVVCLEALGGAWDIPKTIETEFLNELSKSDRPRDYYYRYSTVVDIRQVGTNMYDLAAQRFQDGGENERIREMETLFPEDSFLTRDIGPEEKTKRVSQLLDILCRLEVEVNGRKEDLSPILMIAGLYDSPDPLFESIASVAPTPEARRSVNVPLISQVIHGTYVASDHFGNPVKKKIKPDTLIGMRGDVFSENILDFTSVYAGPDFRTHVGSPAKIAAKIKDRVSRYYEISSKVRNIPRS